MANFLLVHGSCHGAWCWRDVIPQLSALGHSVTAIDLPSHGQDTTPIADVTLDLYAQSIIDAIDTPTIVVGHSMAGYPISRAAEIDPTNVARLVYLCAYVPKAGLGLADMRRLAPEQPLIHAIDRSEDGLSFSAKLDHISDVFYHDCPDDAVELARQKLGPQAILPQETPADLGDNYATVPRTYIVCKYDRTIPPAYQRTMTQDWPQQDVLEMNTSHSPFFADPVGLAQHLNTLANA